ncbi:MAG TPA: ATPase, partial [Porphyromonadaceae bacterium]|nr:ATPase [Porphyromonadaceae bacterium]
MSKQQSDQYYSQPVEDVLRQFGVDLHSGLSEQAAKERLAEHGPNRLESTKQKSVYTIFLEQFKSSMVLILLVAAVISGVIGVMEGEGLVESFVILAILVVNAIIGTVQEVKAQSSLEALNKMSAPHTKVLRGGQVEEIVSTDIVPGDIVVLDTGDIIPADLRLIETANLKIQESTLTGESVPVEKSEALLEAREIPLGDRDNMAFSTSTVTYGR